MAIVSLFLGRSFYQIIRLFCDYYDKYNNHRANFSVLFNCPISAVATLRKILIELNKFCSALMYYTQIVCSVLLVHYYQAASLCSVKLKFHGSSFLVASS